MRLCSPSATSAWPTCSSARKSHLSTGCRAPGEADSFDQHWHALDMPEGSAEAVLGSRSVVNGPDPVAMIVHPPPQLPRTLRPLTYSQTPPFKMQMCTPARKAVIRTHHLQGDGDSPWKAPLDCSIVQTFWDVRCQSGEGVTIGKAPLLKLLIGEVLEDKLAQGIECALPMQEVWHIVEAAGGATIAGSAVLPPRCADRQRRSSRSREDGSSAR